MKGILSVVALAGFMSIGFGMAPAAAAGPSALARASADNAAVAPLAQTVDHRRYHRHYRDRHWDGDRRYYRHHRPRHYDRGPSFSLQFGTPGYYYAPRYRAAPRHAYRVGNAHVRWCQDRYRSYRAWDNTFQPYHGPRRQCFSPYS